MRNILECEIKHRQFRVRYPLVYDYIVDFRVNVDEDISNYLARNKFKKKFLQCSSEEQIEINKIMNDHEFADHIYMHMQNVRFGMSSNILKSIGIDWKDFYFGCMQDLSIEFNANLNGLIEEHYKPLKNDFDYIEISTGIRFCNLSKPIDLLELFYTYFKIQLKFNQHNDVTNYNQFQLYKDAISDYKQLEKFSYKTSSSADSYYISEDIIKIGKVTKRCTSLNLSYFDEPESVSKVLTDFLNIYLSRRADNNQDIVSDDQLALDLYKIKEHTAIAEIIDLLDTRLDKSIVGRYSSHLTTIISLMCWDIEQTNQPKSGGLCNKNNKKEPVHFKVMELITSILESKNESIKLERNEASGRISKITYKDKKGMQIDSADFKDLTTEFIADNIRKNFSNFKQTMNEGFLNRNIKTSKLRN